MVVTRYDEKEFWSLVEKREPHSCWIWKGKTYRENGYGFFKGVAAYRAALSFALKTEIPRKAYVCHKCDNPPCVNPAHLYLGTAKTNSMDALLRGRSKTKLAWGEIQTIRRLHRNGKSQEDLADRFGVGVVTIRNIVHGRTWNPNGIRMRCGSEFCVPCAK